MMIISVAQRKGGSGKTTLSLSIGCERRKKNRWARGYETLIIDADPQATASDWRAAAPEKEDERLPSV